MIKINNLEKTFQINGHQTSILKNINLEVKPGDTFGIIGKTGSGKSTLLRLMNGFIAPNSGEVYIKGKALNKRSRHEIIKDTSMIFQSYNLLENLTVIDNILLPIKVRKLNTNDYLENAYNLLDFVGLKHLKDSHIKTLSGGEKQRIAIARALITNPEIIFCDEPTSSLDDITSYEVLNLLKQVNSKYNTTIVIVSHNTNIIKALCNKIVIIEAGEIKETINNSPEVLTPKTYKEVLLNDWCN